MLPAVPRPPLGRRQFQFPKSITAATSYLPVKSSLWSIIPPYQTHGGCPRLVYSEYKSLRRDFYFDSSGHENQ